MSSLQKYFDFLERKRLIKEHKEKTGRERSKKIQEQLNKSWSER